MLVAARTFITKILKPSPVTHLGRWSLKHDPKICEDYLRNLHPDPGYPNTMKPKWIAIQIKKQNPDTNIYVLLKSLLHSQPRGQLHSSDVTINSKSPTGRDI
jgi:hypothetical protein